MTSHTATAALASALGCICGLVVGAIVGHGARRGVRRMASHEFCSHTVGSPCHLDTMSAAEFWSEELAGVLEPLLNHYRRHTPHRCEIERDAALTLNSYRTAVQAAASEGTGDDEL